MSRGLETMERFSHDLNLALEESNYRHERRKFGLRRRTRSAGNLPAAVAVSLVEDCSSSSPPQAPLITQPLSDSDDPQLGTHKSSLKTRHYCQIGNFESDSFNENFSPTRPANARRKRKLKKMPVDYVDGQRSPPIEILSITAEPDILPDILQGQGLTTLIRAQKHKLKPDRNNTCGKRKWSHRDKGDFGEMRERSFSGGCASKPSYFKNDLKSKKHDLEKKRKELILQPGKIVLKSQTAEGATSLTNSPSLPGSSSFNFVYKKNQNGTPTLSKMTGYKIATDLPPFFNASSSNFDGNFVKKSKSLTTPNSLRNPLNFEDSTSGMECAGNDSSSLSSSDSDGVVTNDSDREGDDELTDWPGIEELKVFNKSLSFKSSKNINNTTKSVSPMPPPKRLKKEKYLKTGWASCKNRFKKKCVKADSGNEEDMMSDSKTIIDLEDESICRDSKDVLQPNSTFSSFSDIKKAGVSGQNANERFFQLFQAFQEKAERDDELFSQTPRTNFSLQKTSSSDLNLSEKSPQSDHYCSEYSMSTAGVTEVREIRAGCRRIRDERPGFLILSAANEQLSKFLQDSCQTELKLPSLNDPEEKEKLESLAKLYSLQLQVEMGRPVLRKTSNTMQAVRVELHSQHHLATEHKRRCYGDCDTTDFIDTQEELLSDTVTDVQLPICIYGFAVDENTHCLRTTLNAYLRYELGLRGTKAMCHEGGCGACLVVVRRGAGQELITINSCLVLIFSCDGWDITTIEGTGNRLDGYSEIQKRMAAFNATQCGYCTPAWCMQMHSLQDKHLTMAELENSFSGNTCRCTGFRPILDAVKSFAVDASPALCQTVKDMEDLHIYTTKKSICQRKFSVQSETSLNGHEWEMVAKIEEHKVLRFTDDRSQFIKVSTEEEIYAILKTLSTDYMLIDGNTGKGLYEAFFEYPPVVIDISNVKSLKEYKFDQNLVFGANIPLQESIEVFADIAKNHEDFAYLEHIVEHLKLVANTPVRNVGSYAGNLMMKHADPTYASDVFLLLETIGAMLTISNGILRTVLKLTDFLKTDMKGKLIINILIPPLSDSHVFRSYKIMPRNQNSLAIVNAAFLLKISKSTNIVQEARIVFGNISPKFIHAKNTELYVVGKNIFNNKELQTITNILSKEINPVDSPPTPSPDCRKKIALGLFTKFILNISPKNIPSSRFASGGLLLQRPVSHGKQDFQTDSTLYPRNQPVQKLEAIIQSAGEAEYANDLPNFPGQVFAAFVLSEIHVGEIDTIDSTEILQTKGIRAIFTAKDIPGKNSFIIPGTNLQNLDEEILPVSQIKYHSQPIAIIVADTEELASRAATKVKVTYKNVSSKPPVLTIDEAKNDTNRYKRITEYEIVPKGRGTNVKHVIKDVIKMESQYWYFMETLTSIAVPVDGGLDIYDSTQCIDLVQAAIAQSLNMKESDIHLKVRRVGGAFGGKVSRNVQVATSCALVASKMNVPCRFIVPMKTVMSAMGKRFPAQCEYEVGVDDNGKIQYLDAILLADKGCSFNELSPFMLTGTGFKNCYNTDYFSLKLAAVLTDTPSTTFMRAPGNTEAITSIEHIMEHIAFTVHKDPTDVRLANMRTTDNDIPSLIETIKADTDFEQRLTNIEQFNKSNRWTKKAISLNLMNFQIAFLGHYSATVSVYRDATVSVTTGGIEMGQGVNTKSAQVCAYELGIPLESVTILPVYSFTSANNFVSAGSLTSQSVSYAIVQACKTIKNRLEPFKAGLDDPTWKDLVTAALEGQTDLTASYMMNGKEPDLKTYYCYGLAVNEVELDVLTGRFQLLRTDILEDVGLSTNPNIDVGQLEGAYVQGLGYYTCEKLVYDKTSGKLLTNRSLTYHVPLALDIPIDFRVKLRYNSNNPKGVLGSKAVGEMGMCTAHGITHALRKAIMASRADSGYDPTQWIDIDIPYDTASIIKSLNVKLEEFLLTE